MNREAWIRQSLPWLDSLLAHEVERLRARWRMSVDEFRGLTISDEQVDALLAGQPDPATGASLPPLLAGAVWARTVKNFALSPVCEHLLLLALAPEIEPRYGAVIAYLNDDVGRRWPTLDLARRLFGRGPDGAAELARALASDGPLFGPGLLVAVDESGPRQPRASRCFAAAPLLVTHLLEGLADAAGPLRLLPVEPIEAPASVDVAALAKLLARETARPLLLLDAAPGTGREAAARALAAATGRGLLRADLAALAADPARPNWLRDAVLHARLAESVLLVVFDGAAPDRALSTLCDAQVPVLLAGLADPRWIDALRPAPLLRIPLDLPDAPARAALWRAAVARQGLAADAATIDTVAARYRIGLRAIEAAAASARLAREASTRGGALHAVDVASLASAARGHAAIDPGPAARRVEVQASWDELVLPLGTLAQLRELAQAIQNRERVFGAWRFARPGGPRGLAALFSGASGTGKTMSAGIVARAAGLDLWCIDLAAVVSKYIGETEKQLERIFHAARDGNAILFFDEADALFGKRSEVKDAHDRYANIEVAYLLQRLEAHDGVAILATNLARNVDPAFSRRMHVAVEFPLPDAGLRERLWRGAFPCAAPLSPAIDFAFLAERFSLAGGEIRVAALHAAFLAAESGGPITMELVLRAVVRQLRKQGKVPSASEFRQYHAVLRDGAPALVGEAAAAPDDEEAPAARLASA